MMMKLENGMMRYAIVSIVTLYLSAARQKVTIIVTRYTLEILA